MNDEISPETAEEAANRERDEAALDRKGATKPCEACGSEFYVSGLHVLVQLVGSGKSIKLGEGGEAVTAFCSNCGLIRLHLTNLLFKDEEEDDASR
ncbi:MAG: hypothetical protein ACTHK6_02280 [Solirubrobacterales bacterium]